MNDQPRHHPARVPASANVSPRYPRRALSAEYVIVGAGITGAAVAAHLARLGASPLVIEAKGIPASGATGSSGGMVRCYDVDPVVARLAAASLLTYSDPTAWISGAAPLRSVGAVTLAAREHAEAFALAAERLETAGWECQVVSETEEVLGVRTAGGAALVEPAAGWVDPVLITELFLRQAVADGATVLTSTRVTRLTPTAAGVLLETTRETVHATQDVVLAVGAWAARPLLGTSAPAGQVRSRAIQTAVVEHSSGVGQHATFIDLRTGGYGKPVSDRTSLVGYPLLAWDVDPDVAVPDDIVHQKRTIDVVAQNLPWLRDGPVLKVNRSFDAFGGGDVVNGTNIPRVSTCRPGNGGGVKVAPELGREIALRLLAVKEPGTAGRD